ncbi:alpha/beta fold hydrolase [Halioglobus maricola]|uniref:Alpha/beta fold hydrolase n=1 Tax=Halioglobus maricola TaxID=2601894 RepID=A0A5P9NI50_9GAMM|nr:alpha/beta fold hydrolase [Halioglobus maricola]QFU75472.1 alpha/beta fold hydrolase [Halioglobus maricola]
MAVIKDLLRLQTDIAVTAGEIALSRLTRKRLLRKIPRGEGQLVMLLPGYMAGDDSMNWLRDVLRDAGFDAHCWGLGQNRGFQGESGEAHVEEMTARIIEKVRKISGASGAKVALVGQSLGGLYSRETAMRYPDEIDRVITLGSPTIHPYISDDQNSFVTRIASRKAEAGFRFSITGKQGFLHWGARQPELPMVAIWSPIDAVVFSQSARIPDYIVQLSQAPAIRENLRLVCSHSGMAFNEAVVTAVADRLAEPVDQWQAFDAVKYFPRWSIELVEQAFGNRLFHEFIYADWRQEVVRPRPEIRDIEDDQPLLLKRLRRDHNDFYQLYAMIEESLADGSFDEESDYLLLADVARFMTDYLDRCHHPLEEFVFQEVLKFHPESAHSLEALEREHSKIAKHGALLLQQVENACDPGIKGRPDRLLVRWRKFCETLRSHVELEETVLFPQAMTHIPARAWTIVQRDWNLREDSAESPLSDVGVGEEFRHLFEYLSYVANRDRRPEGFGDNRVLGRYLDSVVFLSEKLDGALERRQSSSN